MHHKWIAAVVRGVVPVVQAFVAKTIEPLMSRIDTIDRAMVDLLSTKSFSADEVQSLIDAAVAKAVAALPMPEKGKDGTSVTADDVAPLIAAEVGKAVAAIPAPKDGKDGLPGVAGKDGTSVTADDVAPLIAAEVGKAVAAIPAPKDGKDGLPGVAGKDGTSVTADDVAPLIAAEVGKAVAAIPAPKDGKDGLPGVAGKDGTSVTADDVAPLIAAEVGKAVAAIPAPKDGKDGLPGVAGKDGTSVTADDVAPLIAAEVGKAVAAIPAPKDGKDGKLPIVRSWTDKVHYEGDVCSHHDGATYQAVRDTAKEPPHEDWVCLAAAGRPGADGRSFRVRDTFDAAVKDYGALDVVACNGAAFVARRDNPGACPGPGWQMIAMQGKTGRPGERGAKGDRGEVGPAVERMSVDGNGMLTLFSADGSRVECDFYPVLAKLQ